MAKQKKLVRVVCAVLALLMAATLVLPALSRAFADDETPAEKLERLRKEIAALHDQIEASEENEQNAQQTKLYYQQLSNTLSAQLEALQEDIDVRKSDLEKKNLAIAQAAEELQAAKEAFEQRLRGMYEMRSSSNLSILLGIDDISDAMRFAENLQQIAVSDNQLITEMHDKQVKLENQREEINAGRAERPAGRAGEHENLLPAGHSEGGRDRHGRAGPAAGVRGIGGRAARAVQAGPAGMGRVGGL